LAFGTLADARVGNGRALSGIKGMRKIKYEWLHHLLFIALAIAGCASTSQVEKKVERNIEEYIYLAKEWLGKYEGKGDVFYEWVSGEHLVPIPKNEWVNEMPASLYIERVGDNLRFGGAVRDAEGTLRGFKVDHSIYEVNDSTQIAGSYLYHGSLKVVYSFQRRGDTVSGHVESYSMNVSGGLMKPNQAFRFNQVKRVEGRYW
jgi:hypothetical protein